MNKEQIKVLVIYNFIMPQKCDKINIIRVDEGFVRIWNLIRGFDGFGANKLLFSAESMEEVGCSASVWFSVGTDDLIGS